MKKLSFLSLLIAMLFVVSSCCISHDFELVSEEAASCENSGKTLYVCKNCDRQKEDLSPALGHTFTEEITTTATCSTTGVITKTCSVCDYTEKIVVEKVEHSYKFSVTKEPTLEHPGVETGVCSFCGKTQEKEIAQLGSQNNPGEVNVSKLVSEINSNITSAKNKYNDKWIKITGKVLYVYRSAGMTAYYLHGNRGDTGLRIICWVIEDAPNSSVVDKTCTFVGQVREITTVNATEIGECTMLFD